MIGFARVTPWVGRLLAINAVVLLLLQTVLTAPAVTAALAFDPAAPFARPWTFLTYAFVHRDLWHLVANGLGLWVFGSAVEGRMGGRTFLAFWLFCAAGAALLTAALHPLLGITPFIGASAAVLGTAVAFAYAFPDAELFIFPIPVPVRARTLALLLVGWNALMLLLNRNGGVAYEAHLAGAAVGWTWVRITALGRRPHLTSDVWQPEPEERSWAPTPSASPHGGALEPSGPQAAPARTAAPLRRAEQRAQEERAEIDRVLDKISATGIASLTEDERRFLERMSAKRQQGDAPH